MRTSEFHMRQRVAKLLYHEAEAARLRDDLRAAAKIVYAREGCQINPRIERAIDRWR